MEIKQTPQFIEKGKKLIAAHPDFNDALQEADRYGLTISTAAVAEIVRLGAPFLYRISILNCGDSMTEERKHAILFSATILAARKLAEIGHKPCPAREACIADAIRNAERILQKINERWPTEP